MTARKKQPRRPPTPSTPDRHDAANTSPKSSPIVVPATTHGPAFSSGETVTTSPGRVFTESTQSNVLVQSIMPSFLGMTEDSLALNLREYQEAFEARRQWQFPLMVFLATLIPLISTADFRSFGPITKEQVGASVGVSTIASFLWFIVTCVKSFRHEQITPKDIIDRCRQANRKQ